MSSVKITDNGLKFKSAKNEAVMRALEKIGITAELYAKAKCPVDTGRLRNSIKHIAGKGKNVKSMVGGSSLSQNLATEGIIFLHSVALYTDVSYAPYVELGTSRQRPQPFLKPAYTDHTAEYKSIIEQELKNAKGFFG